MNAPVKPFAATTVSNGTMSTKVFNRVAEIAHREAGLIISESKMAMVKSRLTRRLRALKLATFEDYLAYVDNANDREELSKLISALTTNVSHFFREEHHFATLKSSVLPPLLERAKRGERVRIWSAGCSNGQEPYSIAMTLLDLDPKIGDRDIRILATDIDPEVIATARAGIYAGALTTGLTPEVISRHFVSNGVASDPVLEVRNELKKMVTFRELNLHGNWPMQGQFDAIFCRNVVIYFDEPAQTALYAKFARVLAPGGWLFLGHSERITEASSHLWSTAGVTTYRAARSPETKLQSSPKGGV